MMIPFLAAKRACLVSFAFYTSLLVAVPVLGQAPAADRGEIKALARISKKLIEEVVAREEIVANIPYHAQVVGFQCQGVIDGRGKMSVELVTAQGQSNFVVHSQGSAATCVRGVRGPFVATGPAWGPFASTTRVSFDGRKFTLLDTAPWAQVHGRLDTVEGRRGGPVGRIAGRVLLPLGQRLVPRAEAQATPIAESYLKGFVDQLGQKIVERLDRINPVEKSMNRLFPESRDWVFQVSNDPKYIQAAYGPKGSKVPALPENPARLTDERMEMWLHSTETEAQDLAKLSKLPLAKVLIDRYLETELPELAAVGGDRSVDAVDEWLVISVGAIKD